MFGIERLQTIRELIIKNKSVEVVKLSKEMNVSEVTIRRDLDKLEKEGLVVKTYGGAILNEEMVTPSYSTVKPTRDSEEEVDDAVLDVARTASMLISDGDTIFIDGSDAGKALIRQLTDLEGLVIVTNNIEVAFRLFKDARHKVVMVGGELDEASGNVTEYDQLDELLIEKVFISVDGIDLDVGYTMNDKDRLRLYKKLKSVSRDMIVISDSSVFNKRSLVKMAPLNGVESVVTDKRIPEQFKKYYFENNITVHSSMLSQV